GHGDLMGTTQGRCAQRIAEGDFVKPFRQITGFLKFDRKKLSCRSIYASDLAATFIRTASPDVVHPEFQPRGVGFAVEKIKILLAHQKRVRLERVSAKRVRISEHLQKQICEGRSGDISGAQSTEG